MKKENCMVFLDNASTTKPFKEVLVTMQQVNELQFFNPSALYGESVKMNTQLQQVKANLLKSLGATFFDNIIFTSGATEANNLALRGALKRNGKLVVSMGEHPSVYQTAKQLGLEGYEVVFVNLTENGTMDLNDLMEKLTGATMVSFMHVSNETGAIHDVKQIVQRIKAFNKNILVHVDGVQAFGKLPVNVASLGVDLYTVSSHKVHGPKGVGALYVKKGVNLKPILFGGEQESGLRAGTENVAGILGFEVAVQTLLPNIKTNYEKVNVLKQHLIAQVEEKVKQAVMLKLEPASPYICVVAVPNIKSETLLHLLEQKGFLVANGSACSSRNSDNRILANMGLPKNISTSSIRISFSEENTTNEVTQFLDSLWQVVSAHFNILRK